MPRCPGNTVKCTEPTCKQCGKHYTCEGHQFHIGDCVKDKAKKWTGYVYDANPWGAKRSVFVMWETPHFEEGKWRSGKLYMGHASCVELENLCCKTSKPTSAV